MKWSIFGKLAIVLLSAACCIILVMALAHWGNDIFLQITGERSEVLDEMFKAMPSVFIAFASGSIGGYVRSGSDYLSLSNAGEVSNYIQERGVVFETIKSGVFGVAAYFFLESHLILKLFYAKVPDLTQANLTIFGISLIAFLVGMFSTEIFAKAKATNILQENRKKTEN